MKRGIEVFFILKKKLLKEVWKPLAVREKEIKEFSPFLLKISR
jgi:hypothetical protein